MDWNAWNKGIIEEFRANGGKVGEVFEGKPMVVITTTGAKSGAKRENPLIRLEDGGKMYIIASKGGAPDNPDWYYNLLANPELTVETGVETFAARAKVVEDEAERRRLYDKMVTVMDSFAEYEKSTTRRIPVVELARLAVPRDAGSVIPSGGPRSTLVSVASGGPATTTPWPPPTRQVATPRSGSSQTNAGVAERTAPGHRRGRLRRGGADRERAGGPLAVEPVSATRRSPAHQDAAGLIASSAQGSSAWID